MIERKFVAQKIKEFQIQEFIEQNLRKVGHSHTKLVKTPLGEKIIVFASRPGLIVGRKGENIKKLTKVLKKKFELENPQIEISEIESPNLDAQIVAEKIANSLERFGTARFKGIGHKALTDVIGAGARGVEVLISGKIPSSRAKKWRFYMGFLKKSGDIAVSGVDTAYSSAKLKTGVVGIQVRIMPASTKMPDEVIFIDKPQLQDVATGKVEVISSEKSEDKSSDKKPKKKKAEKSDGDKKTAAPKKKAAAPKKKAESEGTTSTAKVEEILKEEVQ